MVTAYRRVPATALSVTSTMRGQLMALAGLPIMVTSRSKVGQPLWLYGTARPSSRIRQQVVSICAYQICMICRAARKAASFPAAHAAYAWIRPLPHDTSAAAFCADPPARDFPKQWRTYLQKAKAALKERQPVPLRPEPRALGAWPGH